MGTSLLRNFIGGEHAGTADGRTTPWNYPMVMAVGKFAPAIAAGNAVVLKPSDTTPAPTLVLAEIAADSGTLGTAKTCPCTGSRTTPGSST